ncbi:MAG: DUF721 domain-containing protein [Phycisphaerales bacterium]|nr:DUF721 domain-containing protein [Phycisphaerales bacterium]
MQDPRLARLARIAPYRRRRDFNPSIGEIIESTKKKAVRDEKRFSSFSQAWEQLVPAEILACSRLSSTRGTTITIEVDSSPAKYELDRLLRTGLEANLRRLYSGPLTRIKTKLGATDQSDPG